MSTPPSPLFMWRVQLSYFAWLQCPPLQTMQLQTGFLDLTHTQPPWTMSPHCLRRPASPLSLSSPPSDLAPSLIYVPETEKSNSASKAAVKWYSISLRQDGEKRTKGSSAGHRTAGWWRVGAFFTSPETAQKMVCGLSTLGCLPVIYNRGGVDAGKFSFLTF